MVTIKEIRSFLGLIVRRTTLNKINSISIEITNRCNSACKMCPRKDMFFEKKHMEILVLNSIIDDIQKHNINGVLISLSGMGEPILHPYFPMVLKTIHKRLPGNPISINTNCLLLKEKTDMILSSLGDNDIVSLSISSDNQKGYDKLIGGKLSVVEDNVRYFLMERKKQGKNIRVFLRFIETPYTDFDNFNKKWVAYTEENVEIRKYLLRNWGGIKTETPSNRYPCASLWKSLVYDVEGNLFPCCKGYEYRSTKLFPTKTLRKEQKKDIYSGVCKNCDFWISQPHHIRFLNRWW